MGAGDIAKLFSRVLDLVDAVRVRDEEIRMMRDKIEEMTHRIERLENLALNK